jgi:hypothetical protein
MHNPERGTKEPKNVFATSAIIQKTAQSKQLPIGRKFGQSVTLSANLAAVVFSRTKPVSAEGAATLLLQSHLNALIFSRRKSYESTFLQIGLLALLVLK